MRRARTPRSSAHYRQRPTSHGLEAARDRGWRLHWFNIIFHHDAPAERGFDIVLILAILASVMVVLLDSVSSIQARWHDLLQFSEWVFTALFTLEYALRLATVRRPLRYAASFFGVIDLLAILPAYLSLLLPVSSALMVVRVLRLLRIFRILKLVEYSSEGGMLLQALVRSRRKILVFMVAVLTLAVIFGALMYVVEGPAHGFTSIPTAMYWAIVTMATVGFGDIAPATGAGRLIATALILIGYGIIAVPTGIYTAELARGLTSARRDLRCLQCGLQGHEADARHCRGCGARLPGPG